jgi:endonuclease/exonuclease/phosphatase family metal-dependent hydrolase
VSRLRFATWNVQEGMPEGATDPRERPGGLAALVRVAHEHSIDVLALQEVDFDKSGRSSVLEALCAETELREVRSHVLSTHRSSRDIARASRWPAGCLSSTPFPS